MGIGILLKDLISQCNTNVPNVSRATGVPSTTIYSIINRDSKNANISDLYKIAHHLGVTLDYFYDGETKDDSNLFLSEREKSIVAAYRRQPAMQDAVDKLLGIPSEINFPVDDVVATINAIDKSVQKARCSKTQK